MHIDENLNAPFRPHNEDLLYLMMILIDINCDNFVFTSILGEQSEIQN